MSMLHDYIVLRSRGKSKREKINHAIYSLFYGDKEDKAHYSYDTYRELDDVYCPSGEDRMIHFSSTAIDFYDTI